MIPPVNSYSVGYHEPQYSQSNPIVVPQASPQGIYNNQGHTTPPVRSQSQMPYYQSEPFRGNTFAPAQMGMNNYNGQHGLHGYGSDPSFNYSSSFMTKP